MPRLCYALDLKNDPRLIEQYMEYHRAVWPEILESIRGAGILDMQIFHVADRLFMIMETEDGFSLEAKAQADASNAKVIEWETLMSRFQQPLPSSPPGVKWMPMSCIFHLAGS